MTRATVLFVQPSANRDGSAVSGLLTVRALIESGRVVAAWFRHNGPMIQEYAAAGATVEMMEHGNWLSPPTAWLQARRWLLETRQLHRVVGALKRLRPAVVYANSLVSAPALVAARWLGIPTLWHIRELLDDVGGEMVRPPVGGRLLVAAAVEHLADTVVTPSAAIIRNILGSADQPQAHIVPNAVPREYFEDPPARRDDFLRRLDIAPASFVIGIPGTLRPVKGHLFFLTAMWELLRRSPNMHVLVSGGPVEREYSDELLRKTRDFALESRVHQVGEFQDMRSFYEACDVICIPSRSESFGRTAIEAFAMRRPVIATRVGGLAEIVTDQETGLLVDYGDERGLAAAIHRLQSDAGLRRRLADAGRRAAESRFHESCYARRIVELVNQLSTRASEPQ